MKLRMKMLALAIEWHWLFITAYNRKLRKQKTMTPKMQKLWDKHIIFHRFKAEMLELQYEVAAGIRGREILLVYPKCKFMCEPNAVLGR